VKYRASAAAAFCDVNGDYCVACWPETKMGTGAVLFGTIRASLPWRRVFNLPYTRETRRRVVFSWPTSVGWCSTGHPGLTFCTTPVAASFQLAVYTRNTTSCRFLLADLRRLVLNRPSRPDLLYDSRGGKFSTCRMRPRAPEDGILWPRPKVSQLMSSGTCRSICCAKCDGNKSPAGADPLEKPDAEQ